MPYYGGKQRQAPRIVSLLPTHGHYVEPFAGSFAVLLAKRRSSMETLNDIDGDVMAFWRVLRDRHEDLAGVMALTPHSRDEHRLSYEIGDDLDDLERARRVWVRLSQSRGATMRPTGWRFHRNHVVRDGSTAERFPMPHYLASYVERVPACARRLAGVSLECRDALEVIGDYGRHPDVLLYCDPPYLLSTRSSSNYRHELVSADEHRDLADVLLRCRSSVVLSGYDSDLYRDLYDAAGWHRFEYGAWTGNGMRDGADKTSGDRTEVLWSNRPIGEPTLFDVGEVIR
jgi:DNA adenine methylase